MAVKPKTYTEEHRLRIPITGDQRCYVISGQADFSSEDSNSDGHPMGSRLRGVGDGNSDERWFTVGPVHMIVGPKWNVVDDVSTTVGVVGVSFVGSDETDSLGYEITSVDWDEVDDPDSGEGKRIRLIVEMRMCGGRQSTINMLSYHVVALGKFFGISG